MPQLALHFWFHAASRGQSIAPQDITVMHLDQVIIQGTQLKGFLDEDEDRERWMISLSYSGDLLTFLASKSNVRQKDEFYSQFALQLGNQVWETSPSTWFDVEDCNSGSQSTIKAEKKRTTTTIYAILSQTPTYRLANPTERRGMDKLQNDSLQIDNEKYSSFDDIRQMIIALIAISVISLVILFSIIYYIHLVK